MSEREAREAAATAAAQKEESLAAVVRLKAKIKAVEDLAPKDTNMEDGAGPDSTTNGSVKDDAKNGAGHDEENGGVEEDHDDDNVEEFEGWTLEDHHNEMLALQNEFERLAKKHYDDTCSRIDEQIRAINSGTDADFKKNLQVIDKQYKRMTQALDARKKMEMKSCETMYDGELYAVELTYKEDRLVLKNMLIDQIRRKRLRQLEPSEDGRNESLYYRDVKKGQAADENDGGTEEDEWEHNMMQEESVPRRQDNRNRGASRKHAKAVSSPGPTTSSNSRSSAKRRLVVEVTNPPVVYMLTAKEIQEDMQLGLKA